MRDDCANTAVCTEFPALNLMVMKPTKDAVRIDASAEPYEKQAYLCSMTGVVLM